MWYTFDVPAVPVAKARPRATTVGGKARMYTPKTTAHFEALVAEHAAMKLPGVQLQGPLEMKIIFYMPRPKRLYRKCDSALPIPHTSRPDIDNLAKSVLDGLSRHMQDDAQVYRLALAKYYAGKEQAPCVRIEISTAGGRHDDKDSAGAGTVPSTKGGNNGA